MQDILIKCIRKVRLVYNSEGVTVFVWRVVIVMGPLAIIGGRIIRPTDQATVSPRPGVVEIVVWWVCARVVVVTRLLQGITWRKQYTLFF